MGVDIQFDGFTEIIDKFQSLEISVDKASDEFLESSAEDVKSEAVKILTREQSTHHKGNKYFQKVIDTNGKIVKGLYVSKISTNRNGRKSIRVVSRFEASSLVEYGHSGNTAPAHPFLRPAKERTYAKQKQEAERITDAAKKSWDKG